MVYLFATGVDFINQKLTGAQKRFLELVDGLSDCNKVILIAPERPECLKSENIEFIKMSYKKYKYFPAHICFIINVTKALQKQRKDIKFDKAVSFGFETTISYKFAGIPVDSITTLLREDTIEYHKAIKSSKFKLMYFSIIERIVVNASKRVIIQCKQDKDNLIARTGKYIKDIDKRVVIQINNVNMSWMNKKITRHNYLSDGIIRILFIGNFANDRKGHGILLPVIATLLDEGYNIKLVLVGDGEELGFYKKMYKRYNSIEFVGRLNEVNKYLNEADFMVVPSLADSCPNTVLEGLNAGIAVYGSNMGGIPDLLCESQYMFEPNKESLYYFLKRILDEKSYIQDAHNQKKLKQKLTFDWVEKIKDIIDL